MDVTAPMLDEHYVNPKLTKLYDLDSGWSPDRDFYLSLAHGANDVLDLGCGTGLLAEAFAKKCVHVCGVDPAKEMLGVAQLKRAYSNIEWIQAAAQTFKSNRTYDLIVMTGHAFQVLMTAEDVLATFKTMRLHLKPHGIAVFESRNPIIEWADRWAYNMTLDLKDSQVQESRRFTNWDEDTMHFEFRFQFPDEVIHTQSKIRFWKREKIEELVDSAGLQIEEFFGDWNRSPFNETSSEEMIFILRNK